MGGGDPREGAVSTLPVTLKREKGPLISYWLHGNGNIVYYMYLSRVVVICNYP